MNTNTSNISLSSDVSAHQTHNRAIQPIQPIDTIDNIDTLDESLVAHNLNAATKRRRTRNRRSKKRKWLRSDCCAHSRNAHNTTQTNLVSVRSCGQPLAPYNTTQFIINDHCNSQLDFDQIDASIKRMHKRNINEDEMNTTTTQNDDHNNSYNDYTSDDDEHESNYYLQQQFHEAYDDIHAERLNSMNKTELVEEYLQLEDRVEDLERRLKESRESRVGNASKCCVDTQTQTETEALNTGNRTGIHCESDSALNDPISRIQFNILCEENERLRCDNVRLQRIVDQTLFSSDTSHNHSNHNHHQNDDQN